MVSDKIALFITLILAILFYSLRIIFKFLFKSKMWMYRFSLSLTVLWLFIGALNITVYAPKAEAVVNGINYQKHTSEYDQIHSYIEETFGQYSNKAFIVLQGEGCSENKGLNPTAINRNWSKVQGVYSSSDYGIFQINDHWQGVTNTNFLFDYKTNINMAWVIFRNSGYNFHLWTCGAYHNV